MTFDRRDIPLALYFKILFCGDCPHAHLIWFDDQHRPMGQAVMSALQADEIADAVRANDPNFKEYDNPPTED